MSSLELGKQPGLDENSIFRFQTNHAKPQFFSTPCFHFQVLWELSSKNFRLSCLVITCYDPTYMVSKDQVVQGRIQALVIIQQNVDFDNHCQQYECEDFKMPPQAE